MLESDSVGSALRRIYRPGDDFSEVFAEHTTTTICRVISGERTVNQVRTECGMAMRRVRGVHSWHAHVPDVSDASLYPLTQALRGGSVPEHSNVAAEPAGVPLPQVELARIAHEASKEAQRVAIGHGTLRTTVYIRSVRHSVFVARSDARTFEDVRHSIDIRIEAIARWGQKLRTGRRIAGAASISELCRNNQHLHLARAAAETALIRLEAIEAPSGDMTVILGPGGPAALLHEVCGHALEADLAQHPKSTYHNLLGAQIAAPNVTLIDDPGAPAYAPIYGFDDEGETAQPTVLVEKGILRTYLYDRQTAAVAGRASNGHGRRISYGFPPLPRMSTTYVAAGDSSPEEIIAETDRGLLVQSFSGGDTSILGRFNLSIDEGYLVEHGKVTAPIREAIISGYGPDVLRSIDRVGNDLCFLCHSSACNKLNQFPLRVSLGQPTLRVGKLSVWGG